MRIKRFIDGAVATDGGTISCKVVLNDGSILELGLDARVPKTKAERQIFIGAGYPTAPGAQLLARNSSEERDVISAIQSYIDYSCGPQQAQAMMNAQLPYFEHQDSSVYLAILLMQAIADR